ncbi:MAG: EAL domain-containing protein [Planctomycetaceae bacterium]
MFGTERQIILPPKDAPVTPSISAKDNADGSFWTLCGQSDGNDTAQRIGIKTQPFSVGRHPDNSLCIANSTVSGRHAELILAGDQILVRDRDSTNGTLLNGRRIQTVEALRHGDILHFGNVMFTLRKASRVTESATVTSDSAGEALAQIQFSTLLSRPGVQPHYQPILHLATRECLGYEVLSRSQFIGLETPAKMFRVAAQRTSEGELSRICRLEGLRGCDVLGKDVQYFLNTHPAELNRAELIESLYQLREEYPDLHVVLEVHESGATSLDYLQRLKETLQELKMGLAYDDFGAGQARLMELIEVPPDVLKFDVKLVQGLPAASETRRSTVASLIRIVRDLDVVPLAEGVETEEEARVCTDLGFELAQGFLFGKGEPAATWATGTRSTTR